MTRNKTIKALTLLSFVILLTSFIAFKSGIFDRFFKPERDKPVLKEIISKIETMPIDTPPTKMVETMRVNPTMLSTSKSLILLDQKIKFPIKVTLKKDSTKQ